MLRSIEICAGAGGQALGLEQAGFDHVALVEIEPPACETLRANRPEWNVIEGDVRSFSATEYEGQVDLLAGGVPCPPFSVAGKRLRRLSAAASRDPCGHQGALGLKLRVARAVRREDPECGRTSPG